MHITVKRKAKLAFLKHALRSHTLDDFVFCYTSLVTLTVRNLILISDFIAKMDWVTDWTSTKVLRDCTAPWARCQRPRSSRTPSSWAQWSSSPRSQSPGRSPGGPAAWWTAAPGAERTTLKRTSGTVWRSKHIKFRMKIMIKNGTCRAVIELEEMG